jgi:hypothetical protein
MIVFHIIFPTLGPIVGMFRVILAVPQFRDGTHVNNVMGPMFVVFRYFFPSAKIFSLLKPCLKYFMYF